jgi:hypothetical protein
LYSVKYSHGPSGDGTELSSSLIRPFISSNIAACSGRVEAIIASR